jgi:hypothetical protein
MTWDDFTNAFMPAGAKAKAEEFILLGENTTLDSSSFTYGQARALRAKVAEINDLLSRTMSGVSYLMRDREAKAVSDYQIANPSS